MRSKLVLAAACLALATALPGGVRAAPPKLPGGGRAVPTAMVVATASHYLPGDRLMPVPMLAVVQGTGVQFANADFTPHSLESVDRDVNGRPIFDSGMLYFSETAAVAGVESLPPGAYEFYCYSHPSSMRGSLLVVAAQA